MAENGASWGWIIRIALLFGAVLMIFFMVVNTIEGKPLLSELQIISLPIGIALGILGARLLIGRFGG